MPRLPVSRPTTSFATKMTTPIATETAATITGRRPRDSMALVEHRSRGQQLLLGAERDDQVAFRQAEIRARVDVQSAVAAAHREQLRALGVEQAGVGKRLADRLGLGLDQHLFESDVRLAVVQRVEHVDHRGMHGELRHQVSGHSVGGDDAVGARELEAPYRLRVSGAGDDVQLRVQRPSGEHDVHRALVAVHRRDEAPRAIYPRAVQDVLARGVAFDIEPVLLLEAAERFLGAVDDHVLHLVVVELDDDLGADTSVAAHDEVVAELLKRVLHLPLSPEHAECVFGERLGEDAETEQHRTYPDHYQHRAEGAARDRLRMDLAVADRADGDDRHEEGVEQVPALDKRVAGDAERDHDREQHRWQAKPQQRVLHAAPHQGPALLLRRRFSIFSTARQCAGAAQVRANSAMAFSASSGLRCGRTESTDRLMPATAAGGAAAMPSASSCMRASKRSLGTTSSTRPARMASSAVRALPVSVMCSARARPTRAARRSGAPQAGMRPRLTCGKPIRAWAAAMRKSHAGASSAPPPSASPLRAATTGMRRMFRRSSVVRIVRAICAACSAERMCSSSFRSPPAQNALSPAPRMTSTRARFDSASSSANPSARMAARFNALRAWGRSMATVATPPWIRRVKPSNARVAGAAGLVPAATLFLLPANRGRASSFKKALP